MMSVFLSIAVLHWAVLITPGVNFVLMAQLAAGSSRSVSLAAVAGITTVTFLWATLAILGMGALLMAHPLLRLALQIAGGAYLCLLAYRLWRSPAPANDDAPPDVQPLTTSRRAAFRMGFITNVFNPKTALFFGSVFATTLPPAPSAAVLAGAVALVWCNAVLWHLFLALAFSQGRVQAGYQRWRVAFNRGASALVGGFGLRLLTLTLQELRWRG